MVIKMNKLKNLQSILKNKNIAAYIIPTSDYHNSEYISDHFKSRAIISGFTGSAGTLLVTQTKAFLWADGRYHIQAQKELENTDIILMKQGLGDVPTLIQFLNSELNTNDVLAFDGRLMNANSVINMLKDLKKGITIKSDVDLINEIWNDRPELPFSVLYRLDEFFCGSSFEGKIEEIRTIMKTNKANVFVLSKLEDQAWLYNLRGNDVKHTPVFLSYSIITNDSVILFIDENKIDLTIEKYLSDNDIIIKPYFDFYDYIKNIRNKNILLDLNNTNYLTYVELSNDNNIIVKDNPTMLLKAIKNNTEIENIKLAHIKDGLAFTKFMYYVKTLHIPSESSEISLSNILADYRKEQEGFVDLSFDTICGFKEHGAMMHYSATEESNYKLKDDGLLLVDSGGHYLEGSTDITRTLAIGKITDTMKLHFTTVLKSVIALSEAVFLKGCRGTNLDILARGPIWQLLMDYKCGTGHGIGYLLSVHEAPNGFRWQVVPERNDSAILEPGMITTNEPGIYIEGQYGIRIENELLCVSKAKNEYGEFLGFETITYAPIDLDAINPKLLTQKEKDWLNNYHHMVYEKLSPYMSIPEKKWLKVVTRRIEN